LLKDRRAEMLGALQPSSAIRCSSYPYSPKCVEGEFSELRLYRILGS
jgi:hypothetical protein